MMNTFTPLIIPGLLGLAVTTAMLPKNTWRYPLFLTAALAFPSGFGLLSLLLFGFYLLSPEQAKMLTLATALLMTAAVFLWTRIHHSFRFTGPNNSPASEKHPAIFSGPALWASLLLLAFVLFYFFEFFFNRATTDVHGGWDARYFWNLKARFLFRSPAQWRNMFAPELGWSHVDYPLFLPTVTAWGWHWLGKEAMFWPILTGLVFLLSLTLFVIWYVSEKSTVWIGILAGAFFISIPSYQFWSTTQYADIPLSFFITSAGVFLIEAITKRKNMLFFLSGCLAGFSIWTKNEGIFFSGWAFLILLFRCWTDKSSPVSKKISWLMRFGAGIAIPAFAAFYLKRALAQSAGEFFRSDRSLSDIFSLLANGERSKMIATAFFVFKMSLSNWGILWPLFLTAFLSAALFKIRDERWFLFVFVLLIETGYFWFLHITPYGLGLTLQTTLHRLMLHSGALAVLFAFDVFRIPPKNAPLPAGLKP